MIESIVVHDEKVSRLLTRLSIGSNETSGAPTRHRVESVACKDGVGEIIRTRTLPHALFSGKIMLSCFYSS